MPGRPKNVECVPSELQQEFIRLVAPSCRYLGFADTNHSIADIRMFTLSHKMVTALEQAGKKNFFIEDSQDSQAAIDALREGKPATVSGYAGVLSAEARQKFLQVFANSVYWHPAMKFIASDQRTPDVLYAGIPPEERAKVAKVFTAMQEAIARKETPDMKILSEIGVNPEYLSIFADNVANNDRAIRDYIAGFTDGGAVMFGAQHFSVARGKENAPAALGTLLAEKGDKTCIVAVYKNATQERQCRTLLSKLGKRMNADAVMYVDPPPSCPEGVKVLNPELQPQLEKASSNAKTAAAFRPIFEAVMAALLKTAPAAQAPAPAPAA